MVTRKIITSEALKEREAQRRDPQPPNLGNEEAIWSTDFNAWVAKGLDSNIYVYFRSGHSSGNAGEYRYRWPIPEPPTGCGENEVVWNTKFSAFVCPVPGFNKSSKSWLARKLKGNEKKKESTLRYHWTEDAKGKYSWRPLHSYNYSSYCSQEIEPFSGATTDNL